MQLRVESYWRSLNPVVRLAARTTDMDFQIFEYQGHFQWTTSLGWTWTTVYYQMPNRDLILRQRNIRPVFLMQKDVQLNLFTASIDQWSVCARV